jgi:hypothetical protein
MIAHMVYFELTDNSDDKVRELVAACHKHLSGHPGVEFFAAGPCAREFDRPVNDRDWDVALHLVFRTRADHDAYQTAPRHQQFIAESKPNWKKVRVFDAQV